MVDFRKRDARGVQTVADCRRRKSGGVLHAVKPLFLDGSDQAAVGNQGRGGVTVIGIDPEYVHPEKLPPASTD